MSLAAKIRRFVRDGSGVAAIEFALAAPFLLTAGLWGAELANFTVAHMRVGQLAVHIADNGSRIGDTSTLQDRKIYESDISDLIYGAHVQGGKGLEIYEHGRVIISSLEVDADTGNQYIHWQRCRGAKNYPSSYGVEGDGLSTVIAGMGPAGQEVQAQPGDAVIFVEIRYEYQPLVTTRFIGKSEIRATAAFTVRDDRDLSQIFQRDASNPDSVQDCNTYKGTPTIKGASVS